MWISMARGIRSPNQPWLWNRHGLSVVAEIQFHGRGVKWLREGISLTLEAGGVLRNNFAETSLDVRGKTGANVDVLQVERLGVDALIGVSFEPRSKLLLTQMTR
jgi:hypothetical protein